MGIRLTTSQLNHFRHLAATAPKSRKRQTNKIPVPPEKDVQRAVLKVLKDMGINAWRTNSGMQVHEATENSKRRVIRSAPSGTPDIIGWLPGGRFLGIECKRPGERPTDIQVEKMRHINRDGGIAFWCDDPHLLFQAMKLIIDKGWKIEMEESGDFIWISALDSNQSFSYNNYDDTENC